VLTALVTEKVTAEWEGELRREMRMDAQGKPIALLAPKNKRGRRPSLPSALIKPREGLAVERMALQRPQEATMHWR